MYLLCTKREEFTLESYTNFRRLLEILEVDVDRLQLIERPTQFDKVILPDESFFLDKNGRQFTLEYREAIDYIRSFALKNWTPTSSKKIYYFYGRRGIGEEHLAEYFKSKGYDVIKPEKLTLDEQLNILINCQSFASIIGSISHNSVFMRDGQELILIPRGRGGAEISHQLTLNQVNLSNANYIDSTLSIFGGWAGNSCYIISPQLKQFFGDKWDGYAEEDFKNFLQYVKGNIKKGQVVDPRVRDYYAPILEDFMAQLKQRKDLIASYNMPPLWEQFQPTLTYQTHIAKKGWVAWQNEEQISGSLEDKLDIQAVRINFPGHKVFYSVYFNDKEGWSEEVSNCETAGTTGKSKSIYGIRIRLDEAGAKEFDIFYRVHKFDGEWSDWAKNGETIYSHGVKLNAIQIKLEPKK